MDKLDVAVIGGGTAGYAAAIHASQLGANVALIEKSVIGGTCLNQGCIPTKTLVRCVELLQKIRKSNEFGIEVENVSVNFSKLLEHKNQIVKRLVSGVELLIKANHVAFFKGEGAILTPHSIQVGDRILTTEKIIIATGSKPARLSISGVDLPGVFTTEKILDLKEIPESMVIIGGGYIGIEFAGIFKALGTRVTVIEALPRCLATVDEEIGNMLIQVLRRNGVEIRTNALIQAIAREGSSLRVLWNTPNGEENTIGQVVLVAVGRWPYSEGLGLEKLGVLTNRRAILVNEHLETNIPGIYSVGDVLGKSMLAHVGFYEAEIAVKNALGHSCIVDYRVIPKCIFTYPEIASVGITERQAKEAGKSYKVSRFPFGASGAAVTMNEAIGSIKMICDTASSAILGTHIIGSHASELIAEVAIAMKTEATAKDIANTIHAHPTLAEVVREVAMGQVDGALHIVRTQV